MYSSIQQVGGPAHVAPGDEADRLDAMPLEVGEQFPRDPLPLHGVLMHGSEGDRQIVHRDENRPCLGGDGQTEQQYCAEEAYP